MNLGAFAFARYRNLVMANEAYVRFRVVGMAPAGLSPFKVSTLPRLNLLRLVFDPKGVRARRRCLKINA
jgi:hypothetical protein